MKVLYLFNRVKENELKNVEKGLDHDNHFFGMLRLKKYGIDADYIEMEKYFSIKVTQFLRRHILNIHFIHAPLIPRFFKYDIVFTSTAFGSFLILALLGIKKPKWVIFDYNLSGLIGNRKTLREKIMYFLASKARGIITISDAEAETMRMLFPEKRDKIKFMHLGTDTEFFKPKDLEESDFILSVGRDPGRDFKTLIEAVKGLDIEVKLTARRSSLKNLEPLPKNVTVHDFTPMELVEQYAKARLVIIPLRPKADNDNDAMGCSTLMESMAMGKAVITTSTNTMRSYITDNVNGMLVQQESPEELRKVMLSLYNDKARRDQLGVSARAFIENNCSADKFSKGLAEFFKNI